MLAQRHSELPKLIEVCQRYMGHEKETLEAVTRSRMAVDAARESESPEVIEKA